MCSAEAAEKARAAAGSVRELLGEHLTGVGQDARVLGPAALFRLRARERSVVVVKAGERRAAVRAVGEVVRRVAATRTHAGVSFSVDVDPQ